MKKTLDSIGPLVRHPGYRPYGGSVMAEDGRRVPYNDYPTLEEAPRETSVGNERLSGAKKELSR